MTDAKEKVFVLYLAFSKLVQSTYMQLDKIVSITGPTINGLFKVAANKDNGLIVEDLATGKRKFVAARRHQFTPLNTVGIYTDDGDAMDIGVVFKRMKEQEVDNPPIKHNSKEEELREYFTDILPSHDKDAVYARDIKRVIKWYNILKDNDLLTEDEEPLADDVETNGEDIEEETSTEEQDENNE